MKKKEAKGGNEELQKLYNTPTHSPLQIKKKKKKKKEPTEQKERKTTCRLQIEEIALHHTNKKESAWTGNIKNQANPLPLSTYNL